MSIFWKLLIRSYINQIKMALINWCHDFLCFTAEMLIPIYIYSSVLSTQNNFSYQRPLSLRNGLQTVGWPESNLLHGEISLAIVFESQTLFCAFIGEAQLGNMKIILPISRHESTYIHIYMYICIWDERYTASLVNAETQNIEWEAL